MRKRPSSAHVPEIPEPEQYDDYRAWLRRCVNIYERGYGTGKMRVLAERLGCSSGHLRNIVAGRKALTPSLRARMVVGLELDARQDKVLALLVRASRDNADDNDRAAARSELQAMRRQRRAEPASLGPVQETPATVLTLEALLRVDVALRPSDVALYL